MQCKKILILEKLKTMILIEVDVSMKRKYMKSKSVLFIIAVLSIAAMWPMTKACAQNNLEGNIVGTITTTNGKTIYLAERLNQGVYSIVALTKRDRKYVEEKVFKVKNNYQSVMTSVKYKRWFSSKPEASFFIFNPTDKTLYVPLIDKDLEGGDRYIVYKFDGHHFVYKCEDAGFWLHKSLKTFKRCINVGKTKDYIIRVDKMANGYRYAAWKHKTEWASQSQKPDIIIDDGQLHTPMMSDDDCQYRFWNEGYLYLCFGAYDDLVVYRTSDYAVVLQQSVIDVLNKNEDYPCNPEK